MSFPMRKRINTELPVDRMAALYMGETQARMVSNEGDQPVLEERVYLVIEMKYKCEPVLNWV